jgi:hypothetical protein
MVCAWVALAAAQLPAEGVPAGVHPITSTMLVSTLAHEGVPSIEGDVSVPAGVVARAAAPNFVVLSIEHVAGASDRYWVKIGCRDAGDCIPFFASVVSATPLTCGVRQVTGVQVAAARAPVMHAGDHARLVIRRERSVIEMSVVALESGSIGQSIRIATPDYKQVFHGEVVSATRLEGGE